MLDVNHQTHKSFGCVLSTRTLAHLCSYKQRELLTILQYNELQNVWYIYLSVNMYRRRWRRWGQTGWLAVAVSGSGGGSILVSVCRLAASINNTLHLRSVTVKKSLCLYVRNLSLTKSLRLHTAVIKMAYMANRKPTHKNDLNLDFTPFERHGAVFVPWIHARAQWTVFTYVLYVRKSLYLYQNSIPIKEISR